MLRAVAVMPSSSSRQNISRAGLSSRYMTCSDPESIWRIVDGLSNTVDFDAGWDKKGEAQLSPPSITLA